jgi:hypothetical protein
VPCEAPRATIHRDFLTIDHKKRKAAVKRHSPKKKGKALPRGPWRSRSSPGKLTRPFSKESPPQPDLYMVAARMIYCSYTNEGRVMSAPTVPISEMSHQILKELAEQTGETMTDLLDKAVDTYRRKLFLEKVNAGYAELRADRETWAEHLAERKLWDATLMDGLDPQEHWTQDGACLTPDEGKP